MRLQQAVKVVRIADYLRLLAAGCSRLLRSDYSKLLAAATSSEHVSAFVLVLGKHESAFVLVC